jgi:MoaA/NifB/PqqE/SkfB family radical SAM enzyme
LHLEGNHGDSIYSPNLISFLAQWRDSKKFHIVTNGSRMKETFWRELGDILTSDDKVTFSIDGLNETNSIYRINSDWNSIIKGLDTLVKKGIPVTWKTIVFSHNQHQLDEIEKFAKSRGVVDFKLVKSHRFGKQELQPMISYIDTDRLYENSRDVIELNPQCSAGKQVYVDASGYCWPCCWISSYITLYKTELWKNREYYNIKKYNLDQILDRINDFSDQVKNLPEQANSVCKMMCKS